MTDTIREQIIRKIVTRLAVITAAGGYNTDIGENVQRGRMKLDMSEVPACVVFPLPEEAERRYGKVICRMPVKVEGMLRMPVHDYDGMRYLGESNPSVLSEKILGDLRKCITDQSAISTWTGGLTDDVQYTGGGTDEYPDPEDEVTGANATFLITYKTLAGDPYSQS